MTDVTRILTAIEDGDTQAVDKLLPLVYQELRALATHKLAQERPGQTLQPTALVHEAYIRLVKAECQNWNSRNHFFMAAAEAMRRILVENARRKQTLKKGGDHQRVDLDQGDMALEVPSEDLVALDEALTRLSEEDPAVADLIKLRYFAGLSLDQSAQALKISQRTAARHWAYGRVWLLREITKGNDDQ
jgi:RNA polymerase sigma factor (TIGR02999 family)